MFKKKVKKELTPEELKNHLRLVEDTDIVILTTIPTITGILFPILLLGFHYAIYGYVFTVPSLLTIHWYAISKYLRDRKYKSKDNVGTSDSCRCD